jgi:hypothetical protein
MEFKLQLAALVRSKIEVSSRGLNSMPFLHLTPGRRARLAVRNNKRGSRIATPSYRFQPSFNPILGKAMFSTGSTWLEGDTDAKLDQSRVFLTMAYRPIQYGAINLFGVIEIQ